MFNLTSVDEKMILCCESFKKEIAKQRVGRANPALLSNLMVSSYGSDQILSQVASITAESATTLAVRPWDKKLIPAIEKAIHASELGLTPLTAGDVVRVPFPPLNEERRKELAKIVKQASEHSKVGLRNIRRDANTVIKEQEKSKILAEDQAKKMLDKVQEMTDKFIKQIDTLVEEKEAELMKI